MFTFGRWLIIVLGLLLPWIASAAGLGQINVVSALGQPLHVEIDVLSVRKEDANTLLVRLASPEMYREANVEFGGALHGVSLSVLERPGGQLYIRAATARPVNEPFLNLMVELNWPTGKLVRQFAVLLDPPGYASAPRGAVAARVETQPVPAPRAPVAARVETQPVPAPRAPAAVTTPAPSKAAGNEYGPVKRGETLSKIAVSVKPDGISLDQMLIAILQANPDAFINNNINLLKAGATLKIPASEQLDDLPRDKARQEVRAQISDWNRYRRKLADSPSKAAETATDTGKRATVRVKEEGEAGRKDVLKLSRGQPPGAKARNRDERIQTLEEELIARDRALKEANARIQELEKTVKDTSGRK